MKEIVSLMPISKANIRINYNFTVYLRFLKTFYKKEVIKNVKLIFIVNNLPLRKLSSYIKYIIAVNNKNDILLILAALFLECRTCIQNDVCFNFNTLAAISLLQCFHCADIRRYSDSNLYFEHVRYNAIHPIDIFKCLVIFLGDCH